MSITGATRTIAEPLASAFSPAVIKSLAKEDWSAAEPRLTRLVHSKVINPNETLGQTFDRAHSWLRRNYRNEYIFKNELISKLIFGKHSPRTASALLEVPMGRSCADLLVLNGTSSTYEIKTDLDQLNRLQTQLANYSTRSEHVNVVVSLARAAIVEELAPRNVGIVAIRRSGKMSVIRPSTSNLERLSVDNLFLLLRTDEALAALRQSMGYELDVERGYAWTRARELFGKLSIEQAHAEVVAQLRARGTAAARLVSAEGFPTSLRGLVYATPLSRVSMSRLLTRLSQPISSFSTQ